MIDKMISGDKIKTYKTKVIGTYVDYKIIPLTNPNNGKIVFSILYAIKPASNLIEKSSKTTALKPNYNFIDDNYYIVGVDLFN